jgi:hypothetical protein
MTAILVRFPDESVKLEGVTKRRVLTTLKVIYERGTLHGKTADFSSRDVDSFVVGVHGRSRHFFTSPQRCARRKS